MTQGLGEDQSDELDEAVQRGHDLVKASSDALEGREVLTVTVTRTKADGQVARTHVTVHPDDREEVAAMLEVVKAASE